jgi:hypothetical protein
VRSPQPWSLIGVATSIPSAWSAATVAAVRPRLRVVGRGHQTGRTHRRREERACPRPRPSRSTGCSRTPSTPATSTASWCCTSPTRYWSPQPGSVVQGSKQVRAALEGYLALRGRITLDTKLVLRVGDLAYLSNSWSLRGTGPDGNPLTLGATTAEVARRQADGTWRYVIDNAWGDQGATG